ncbi:energy transducer TonB [Chitinophaga sedimenti]|uniref:energy transducer TonB n=1 Tax=Chitinophaga sedimenti TaxID=2033606 RepID=UPI0020063721|nr:energy transducer TonB [Chitinophaga sedimenti]MCK7554428.1 energy transducer TonB [Chitinophaga sedimenti]
MPSFPGGEEALNKFIWKNLLLPDMDTRYSARLKFIVQSDGNIRRQSITIDGRTPDTSNAMDKALLQMIAKMPLWIPAKQGGHAVHCYTAIPILCIMPQK